MNFSQEIYHTIEKYLAGGLSGSSLEDFESAMTKDPSLAQEVNLQKAMNETMFLANMDAVLTNMNSDFDSHYDKSAKTSLTKKVVLGAGSFLAVTLLGFAIFNTEITENTQKIASIENTQSSILETKDKSNTQEIKKENEIDITNNSKTPQKVKEEEILALENDVNSSPQETEPIQNIEETILPPEVSSAPITVEKVLMKDFVNEIEIVSEETTVEESVPNSLGDAIAKVECPEKTQNISFEMNHPSLDVNDGKVSIQGQFKGLTGDIKYKIIGTEEYDDYSEFENLEPGVYKIEAIDENSCEVTSSTSIELKRTGCSGKVEGVFSSVYGQAWKLNIDESRDAVFKLRDLGGTIVLTKILSGDNIVQWDGSTDTDFQAEPGQYYYELTYSDNEKCIGVITLAK